MNATAAKARCPLAVWISLCVCTAAAFWISNGVAPWNGDTHNAWHHYEYLAEGFLHGHTYLSPDPDPRLLQLKDPYDPDANKPYRLWDASLYQGRYYLYYGPAPAIVLMLPWRVLTGELLPQRLAVGAFAAIGIAGLALLLWEVRNRHFQGVSSVALAGIVVVAFCGAWLPVTLRRSAFWEMPIVSAVAFLWWSIYFLWKFHDSGGRARWALGGGIALSLLMGCRVTFVFAAMAIALLFLVPGEGARRRAALIPGALAFVGGVGLLLYNHARFGRWLEFGQSYQLWGPDYRGLHFFNPANFLFNVRTYILSLPQLGPYFPFLHPYSTDDRPAGYMGFEEIYGVIFMMPVHIAGLVGCAWAWRNRALTGSRPLAVALAASVGASLFAGLILFSWGGACSRYITELLGGWTIATSVGMMAVFNGGPAVRKSARILASVAAWWSVACVCLASAEFRGFMKQSNPGTYSVLAHALDTPSKWWIRGHGIRFGPVDMVLRIPAADAGTSTILVASGRPQRVNQLVLERVDAGHVRLDLVQNELLVLRSPPIAVPGEQLHLRLAAPWLYPPPEHPYWDSMETARARELQTLFSLQWDSGGVETHSTHSVDAVGFEPAVEGGSEAEGGSPYVESFAPSTAVQ